MDHATVSLVKPQFIKSHTAGRMYGGGYIYISMLKDIFNDGLFLMKTKPLTGKTRYRYASQSQWETLPFGAPLYVNYDAVE